MRINPSWKTYKIGIIGAICTFFCTILFIPQLSIALTLSQITNTSADESNRSPSISADGRWIAFHSNSNPLSTNADGNYEIFLYDTNTSTLTQITTTTIGGNYEPSINADGTRIAFRSNSNPLGTNADNNNEIFLYDSTIAAPGLTQITNTTINYSGDPSINADGTRIAFRTGDALNGVNPENNNEVFLYDSTIPAPGFIQITNTTSGNCYDTSINADGTRIAFYSNSNLTGGNADGSDEIFLYDTSTSTFTQITNTTTGTTNRPSISADGSWIAFYSDRNLTGGNADGNYEIFLYNTSTSTFTQITNITGGGSYDPSINADGTRIAFYSDRNLTGGNADGNSEIFLAMGPFGGIGIPTMTQWGMIIFVVLAGLGAVYYMRRQERAKN